MADAPGSTAVLATVPAGREDVPLDLRRPGAILLISCYEMGHSPDGLAVPYAFFERAGFAPACVDVSVQALDDRFIDQARLVAISVPMHTAMRMGARAARRVRARNPDAIIGFFGLYAPLNAAYLRDEVGAALVLGGECEDELLAWVEAMDGRDARALDLDEGRPRELVSLSKLDFPVPARQVLPPPARYAHFDRGDGVCVPAGHTQTTRGCLDTCRHCPVPAVYQGRFFVVPADIVLEDIARQVERGARHITFGDPDFLNGPGHGMRIVRAMHQRWPELSFDITAQIAHLQRHAALLPELAEIGCAFVISAVESLNDGVLEKLAKQHRRADFLAVLDRCRAASLTLRPTFVTFTPWTRLDDMRELVDFLVRAELVGHVDPVQLSIRLLVPPGSLLLAASDTRSSFGALDAEALTHTWHHEDPRVDALQRDIAAWVARSADDTRSSVETFTRIRALVYRALGEPEPPGVPASAVRRAPRITEPWFC